MNNLKIRNSNYEMLRIISMMLIISWHYATQFGEGGTGFLEKKISLFHIFAALLGSWGQLGVDLFIIISVFFLCKSNRFTSYKVVDLSLVSVFYGMFWTMVCLSLNIQITNAEIVKGLFATFTGDNWFAFSYILLYIFHPILNNVIGKCSDTQLKKTTILLTIFICGLKTIYHSIPICDFLFMINIYFVICYIEKSGMSSWISAKSFGGMMICSLMLFSIHCVTVFIGDIVDCDYLHTYSYYLNLRGSAFVLLDAIFVFYWVKSFKPRYSKIINSIASTSFAVFISHQLIGYKFWYHFLYKRGDGQISSCIHMVISIIVIFGCCSLIDLVRQMTLGKLLFKFCNVGFIKKRFERIDRYMNSTE